MYNETKEILLKMRMELLKGIQETRKEEESKSEKLDIGDTVDMADEERSRQISLLLTDRERQKLRDIEYALSRIEKGTYGICEECGRRIAPERLKVMPFAKLCVPCKSKTEKKPEEKEGYTEEIVYKSLASLDTEDREE